MGGWASLSGGEPLKGVGEGRGRESGVRNSVQRGAFCPEGEKMKKTRAVCVLLGLDSSCSRACIHSPLPQPAQALVGTLCSVSYPISLEVCDVHWKNWFCSKRSWWSTGPAAAWIMTFHAFPCESTAHGLIVEDYQILSNPQLGWLLFIRTNWIPKWNSCRNRAGFSTQHSGIWCCFLNQLIHCFQIS